MSPPESLDAEAGSEEPTEGGTEPALAAPTSLAEAAELAFSAAPVVEEEEPEGPSIDARLGTMLAGWRLDAPIGQGRIAAVYAASNRENERAAVKVMDPQFKGDERVRKRLFREANIARFVEHPSVVPVLVNDVTSAGEPFLIMPRLFGRDLNRLADLHGGRLSPTTAILIALETIDLLAHCHELGVHHRSLAPFNLYVTAVGRVRVFDFGSAYVEGELGVQSLAAFNSDLHGYIAPELLLSQEAVGDARSDIFSLGACLFTMLSGERIGDSVGFAKWLDVEPREEPDRLRYDAIPPLASAAPNLPTEVCALVDRAMARDPGARFQTVDEMRQALNAVLGDAGSHLAQNSEDRQSALTATLATFYSSIEEIEREETGAWRSAEILRSLFRLVENVLYAARRHGWDHGETTVRLDFLVENILSSVVDDEDGMFWAVRPYSFEYRGEAFWEPENPYDKIVYNIFDAGFRKMHLLPGLTPDECREFLRWLTLDPEEDLAIEDDLATMFWQREFAFVRCELISAVVLQDVEDYERLDNELEEMRADAIDHLRATIASRLTGDTSVEAAEDEESADYVISRGSLLDMDPELLSDLDRNTQCMAPLWRGRLAHILSVSMDDADLRGDREMVDRPYDTVLRVAIESDRLSDALELFARLVETKNDPETTRRLVRPFLTDGRFAAIMRRLVPSNARLVYTEELGFLSDRLAMLLDWTPSDRVPHVVEALGRCHDRTILGLLLDFIDRNASGFESELGHQLETANPLLGSNLIAILTEHFGPLTIDALSHAFKSPHAKIRVEAAEVLARYAPTRAYRELRKLIRDDEPRIRTRAVEAIERNKLTEGARDLLDRLAERGFHQLPIQERRAVMRTAVAITDEDGEFRLAELVKSHGLTADEDLDASRLEAVEILAQEAYSEAAVDALKAAARKRWWNSRELQTAAAEAHVAVVARIGALDQELSARRRPHNED